MNLPLNTAVNGPEPRATPPSNRGARAIGATLLNRLGFFIALIAPLIAAVVWSGLPAARAYYAARAFDFPTMAEHDWDDGAKTVELRRHLQKHFLNHNVYIPMEDIVVANPNETDQGHAGNERNPANVAMLMQKACGKGRLYVWIPLKIRVPISGEKVIEWCWKPSANNNM